MTLLVPVSTFRRAKREESFDPTKDYRIYDFVEQYDTPPKVAVVPIIDRTLHRCSMNKQEPFLPHEREKSARTKNVVHPSSASGCARKLFYSVIGAPEDDVQPDPRMERMFGNGHLSHRRIQGYLFEAWRQEIGGVTRVWEDVKIEVPQLLASGEIDCSFELDRKYRYTTEIKTVGSDKFNGLKGPLEEWVVQLHFYMAGLGTKAGILLAENRDNLDMREFWIPFDRQVWKDICSNVRVALLALDQRTEPPKDLKYCYYCRYKTVCSGRKGVPWERAKKIRLPVLREQRRAS